VLAQLLWQRGLFTLHASVVRIGARHVAFMGASGEGKSTTAAALEARGHSLVCDDIAAVPWDERPIRALPAFARIRLYPDSVRGVGDDPARHPQVHGQIDKRLKRAERFVDEPVVLDAMYVLTTGDELAVTRVAPASAVIELLRQSYCAAQLAPIVGFDTHLRMAKAVAEEVPLYQLSRPKDLARLAELVGFIEDHVRG
jgi:hypothetical protein